MRTLTKSHQKLTGGRILSQSEGLRKDERGFEVVSDIMASARRWLYRTTTTLTTRGLCAAPSSGPKFVPFFFSCSAS